MNSDNLAPVYLDNEPVTLRDPKPKLSAILSASGKPATTDVKWLQFQPNTQGKVLRPEEVLDRTSEPNRPIYLTSGGGVKPAAGGPNAGNANAGTAGAMAAATTAPAGAATAVSKGQRFQPAASHASAAGGRAAKVDVAADEESADVADEDADEASSRGGKQGRGKADALDSGEAGESDEDEDSDEESEQDKRTGD